MLLAPHNDDEALFASYIILREKPLVVIVYDSFVQGWTNSEQRRRESLKAMNILGAKVVFWGISDMDLFEKEVRSKLGQIKAGLVYAPSGSNRHHELLGKLAVEMFDNVRLYTTYEGNNLHVARGTEVKPTKREIALKNKALDCYESQLEKNRPHFEAVKGKSEYYEQAKNTGNR